MQWWLSVFFLVNGVWVSGDDIDGWSSRAYPTEDACLERKSFAERECREHPLEHSAMWYCSPGAPMSEPPDELKGLSC
ncbi:hypothetical protein [Lutibaculum baratangense]|uniref:Uncharacterized protein n=1 Tax=Lutibaculum baratangense AMV1 TaxID=631454 RepID=V4RJG5_9HYPH|nr:hypothetical protein [Lutibaculum baratangense]ESR23375.1 hypothetical protein N177_3443 [Lutibaculum baratangense AMV1]